MNLIDIIFILILLGILALGFSKGMIRLAVLILAFYLSVVLASLYFEALGGFIFSHFGSERFAAEYIAFFLVMIIGFACLSAAGLYTFRYVEISGKYQYLDRMGGVLLGLILAALIIGVLSTLLWNLMITNGGSEIELPLFRILGSGVQNSALLAYFADYILPSTYNIVRPVLPESASLIFES